MPKRIVIIQGHPDPAGGHLDHALGAAYAAGAAEGGHEVRTIGVATLDFPSLRNSEEFQHGTPPAAIAEAQQSILWAQHLVVVYPLWLFDMPGLLKAFLEQTFRPGFAFAYGRFVNKKLLKGKTVRIVVTMGMPGFIFRRIFRAHSLRSLCAMFGFCGIKPIGSTLLGGVEAVGDRKRAKWLERMTELGRKAM